MFRHQVLKLKPVRLQPMYAYVYVSTSTGRTGSRCKAAWWLSTSAVQHCEQEPLSRNQSRAPLSSQPSQHMPAHIAMLRFAASKQRA